MKTTLARVNSVLVIAMSILVFLGLVLLVCGIDWLSKDFFLVAAFTFPLIMAAKGIQFIVEKQRVKAFMSIILLSVFCLLSLLFIFI